MRSALSVRGSSLWVGGSPIDSDLWNFARRVRDVQTVTKPTNVNLVIAAAVVVAQQRTRVEKTYPFARELLWRARSSTHAMNIAPGMAIDHGLNFGEDRLSPIMDALRVLGVRTLYRRALAHPKEIRDRIAEVPYFGLKTATFLLFTWGVPSPLLIIDIHHLRQLSGVLEVPVNAIRYRKGRPTASISDAQYRRIESDAVDLLSYLDGFSSDGQLDGRLTSSLIWGIGAAIHRGWDPWQRTLFEPRAAPSFDLQRLVP